MAEIGRLQFSAYDNADLISRQVAHGQHREIIGGLWEELGGLQRQFLQKQGLLPHHSFIDIGAGSFRAGVKLIPYLDVGNYYGIDVQGALLQAGYAKEILPAGLAIRFPRTNFAVTSSFDLSSFGRTFDYGIAQSVFTHMPLQRLHDCLVAVAPYFRVSGQLFVTVFLGSEANPAKPAVQIPGVISHPDQDPYHTTVAFLHAMSGKLSEWRMDILGDWDHPRNQQMISFTRVS